MRHRAFHILVILVLFGAGSVLADTVTVVKKGKKEVLAKDVIVVETEKNGDQISRVIFYYWNSKEKISARAIYDRKDSEICQVEYSPPDVRIKLLEAKGIMASLKLVSGDTVDIFWMNNVYHAPVGYILLGSGPQDDCIFRYLAPGAKTVKEIPYDQLAEIQKNGNQITIVTRKGSRLSGTWAPPKINGHELLAYLTGIGADGKCLDYSWEEIMVITFKWVRPDE